VDHPALPTVSLPSKLAGILYFLADSTRGYRLRPWASPYLRWRIETYSGKPAGQIDMRTFCSFTWRRRKELFHFLLWAGTMSAQTRRKKKGTEPFSRDLHSEPQP
jgi:hypothetical protein